MGRPPSRPRLRPLLLGAGLAATLLALGLAAASPALLRVIEPRPGVVVGAAGVEVMVQFPDEESVAAETLRILLNGADMTGELTTAGNGAYGHLYSLLDGENVLRFEVFGRRWWLPGILLEEAREVRFLVRLPQDLNRG
ncbi:MAG TPA: hypothetical protein VKD72_34485 [Gemmataceae bacterium]|nr:hypothetical protein [Gemmataceae bacterium]